MFSWFIWLCRELPRPRPRPLREELRFVDPVLVDWRRAPPRFELALVFRPELRPAELRPPRLLVPFLLPRFDCCLGMHLPTTNLVPNSSRKRYVRCNSVGHA